MPSRRSVLLIVLSAFVGTLVSFSSADAARKPNKDERLDALEARIEALETRMNDAEGRLSELTRMLGGDAFSEGTHELAAKVVGA